MNKRRKIKQVCDNCPAVGVGRTQAGGLPVPSSSAWQAAWNGGCWESPGRAVEAACAGPMTRMTRPVCHVEEMEISTEVKLV